MWSRGVKILKAGLLCSLLGTGCVDQKVAYEEHPNSSEEQPDQPHADALELMDDAAIWQHTNPFFGTGGAAFNYGAGTPGAQMPNGLVSLGPDTNKRGAILPVLHASGYHNDDSDLYGFSHLHFIGTGVSDFGNLR